MGMDEPFVSDDSLFEAVNVGHEANEFLKHTPLGRHLYDRAMQKYRKAVADFANLIPAQIMTEPELVMQLQNEMQIARSFILWVDEVIKGADRAEDKLRERDMNDGVID